MQLIIVILASLAFLLLLITITLAYFFLKHHKRYKPSPETAHYGVEMRTVEHFDVTAPPIRKTFTIDSVTSS